MGISSEVEAGQIRTAQSFRASAPYEREHGKLV